MKRAKKLEFFKVQKKRLHRTREDHIEYGLWKHLKTISICFEPFNSIGSDPNFQFKLFMRRYDFLKGDVGKDTKLFLNFSKYKLNPFLFNMIGEIDWILDDKTQKNNKI